MKLKLSTVEAEAQQTSSGFEPSPQQLAIYEEVQKRERNLDVEAVAGSGKTTTLIESLAYMKGERVAFGAFNRNIANEIAAKIRARGFGSNVNANTFHSYGFAAWRKQARDVKVEGKKLQKLMQDFMLIDDNVAGVIMKLVSIAKNHGVGFLWKEDDQSKWDELIDHYAIMSEAGGDSDGFRSEILEKAIKLMTLSIQSMHEIIDFDDMIWCPLYTNAPIETYDRVLGDEAQDTNPTRRELMKRMLDPKDGKLIAVGDPKQAIYGFTGADSDAMELIRKEFNCKTLPLTVSYRCPKKVVKHAQIVGRVAHIQAAPTAQEGILETVSVDEFQRDHHKTLTAKMAVLCRNTRPLVSLAFELIRKRIPCHVEGRDIGRGLIALVKKYKAGDAGEMYEKLDTWATGQRERLLNKKRELEAEALMDKVETIRVIVEYLPVGATTWDVTREINNLFGDTEEGKAPANLTLSTVHKAKGREWDTVYLLGRTSYMPSKYAKQDWQLEQEFNLIYVAITRAMRRLVEVDLNKLPTVEGEENGLQKDA